MSVVDILLVEDNKELSDLIGMFLKKDGYVVKMEKSSEEALDFLKENKAKLILLDIMLPGMDGFGFCY